MRRDLEHFEGCLLGGAVGDALGAPVEFMSLAEIRREFGPDGVTDYAKAYGRIGAITDDTQMTLFTAEGLLRAWCRGALRGFSTYKEMLLKSYFRWLETQGETSEHSMFEDAVDGPHAGWLIGIRELYTRRAPGNTCLSALKYGDDIGTVENPKNNSKGCGGVMRAAPVGLHCDTIESAFELGCEIAALTHGHPTGYLTAGCLASIIQQIIAGADLEGAVGEMVKLLKKSSGHEESLSAIESATALVKTGIPSPDKIESLGQGWIAEEALGISIYCALVAKSDFAKAVLLAVNHSGDSDSTGAITGNILGALLGKRAIPARWTGALELKPVIEKVAAHLLAKFRDDGELCGLYPGT